MLYCYDIQLEPRVQRKGLGRRASRPACLPSVRLRNALALIGRVFRPICGCMVDLRRTLPQVPDEAVGVATCPEP